MAKLSNVHTERVFEDELCDHLAKHGWSVRTHLKDATSYSRPLALFAEDLLAFVQETQPSEWAKFKKWHNGQSEEMFLKRVAKQLDTHGTLHVLRHGFKDVDAKFQLCQFRPAHGKNPALKAAYDKNRLTVVRQLHYSLHNENSIDLVLFVNGLPVATAELKTDLTQNIKDAIVQYKKDRQPKDPKSKEPEALLQFKTRALVHFAVSTDEVFMTTKLAGDDTFFLPFNLGRPDGMGGAGAGNPPAPSAEVGYPTWYLWHLVWSRDVWLDILGNFLHLESKEVESKDGKKTLKEALIFPRFHQLDAVLRLVKAAADEGVGHTYLIQHSAGSGKSNSIAWTAHRLANLHNAKDEKVFDTVIVITDRKVLDRQLQETISQFEHKAGVVQAIDENSQQLADALNGGVPVVVTTLQKFPFIIDKVGALKGKKFALIVDEAHSSQSGSAAQKLRKALSKEVPAKAKPILAVELEGETVEVPADIEIDPEDVTTEDIVNQVIQSRQRPDNVSYFAFTATPKAKTMELFGRPGPEGTPVPFHVYSMRQAIEEGFILDVLKHYVSYKTFYKLGSTADDKLVPQMKAKKALARYATLHPYNIAQKVVVIVEHFREHVAVKIGGRAKAMVVTDSRKAAVRYKLAMDKYLKERGYLDMKALVAFSGSVSDPESGSEEFTESNMNPDIKGAEPSEAFKKDEYRVLLVANKYQTGFDQPLLHTMYVDKRLSGVLAVQTLSRLNRTCPGKEDTFVLDFVNKPEEILASFQPYYRSAKLEEATDPNIVHELMTKLNKANVYFWTEVEAFAEAFFDPKRKQAGLHAHLKPAADRFEQLEEEKADEFRKDLGSFLRMYDFLSQIVPYNDPELEKLYVFGKNLMPRLRESGGSSSILELDSDVRLTHYRLQKIGEQQLDLAGGGLVALKPASEVGTGNKPADEDKKLAEIVEKMNDLFSGNLSEADMVGYVTTIKGKLLENETLKEQAANNTEQQFAMGDFKDILTDIVIEGQEAHNNIAAQLLKDDRIFAAMQGMLAKMVWQQFQRAANAS
jgi:type I restriction enzyme R subunit